MRAEGELWHIRAQAGLSVVAIMAVDVFFHFFYILTIPGDLKYASRLPDSALGGCAGPQQDGVWAAPGGQASVLPRCRSGAAHAGAGTFSVRRVGLVHSGLRSQRVPSTCWGLGLISTVGWGLPGAARAQEVGSGVPWE